MKNNKLVKKLASFFILTAPAISFAAAVVTTSTTVVKTPTVVVKPAPVVITKPTVVVAKPVVVEPVHHTTVVSTEHVTTVVH